jgi:hypothetical protein
MNDLLQQLIGMGPGLGAAAAGNGPAFAAFMDGFERARQQDEQRKRLHQQDSMAMQDRDLALQDRERNIERQGAQDERAAQDQTWQNEQRRLQVAGQLSQAAGGAESVPDGEASIDTLFRVLSPEMQSTMAPARDAALSGVQRTVTGRQKKQVEAYVDAALKTSFVADNPDADPEMQLPEHMQRILGKPSARLSELQSFAQLPVGKPAGKPSDEVSWQIKEGRGPDGKPGMFRINPKTGETQPVQGITPEPPRPTQGSDPEVAELRKELLRLQVQGASEPKPPNQYQSETGNYATRVEQAEPTISAVSDSIAGMSLPKFQLQTESWFARPTFQSPEVQQYMQSARNFINAVLRRESGATIQPSEFAEAKQQYLPVPGDTAEALALKKANRDLVISNFKRSAGPAYQPPPSLGGASAKVGDRRRTPSGDLVEWDGKGWFVVRP